MQPIPRGRGSAIDHSPGESPERPRRTWPRFLSISILLSAAVFFWFIGNYYFLDLDRHGTVVVRWGHPEWRFLPSVGHRIAVTGQSVRMFRDIEALNRKKIVGHWFPIRNGMWPWGSQLADELVPTSSARLHWYLGNEQKAIRALEEGVTFLDTRSIKTAATILLLNEGMNEAALGILLSGAGSPSRELRKAASEGLERVALLRPELAKAMREKLEFGKDAMPGASNLAMRLALANRDRAELEALLAEVLGNAPADRSPEDLLQLAFTLEKLSDAFPKLTSRYLDRIGDILERAPSKARAPLLRILSRSNLEGARWEPLFPLAIRSLLSDRDAERHEAKVLLDRWIGKNPHRQSEIEGELVKTFDGLEPYPFLKAIEAFEIDPNRYAAIHAWARPRLYAIAEESREFEPWLRATVRLLASAPSVEEAIAISGSLLPRLGDFGTRADIPTLSLLFLLPSILELPEATEIARPFLEDILNDSELAPDWQTVALPFFFPDLLTTDLGDGIGDLLIRALDNEPEEPGRIVDLIMALGISRPSEMPSLTRSCLAVVGQTKAIVDHLRKNSTSEALGELESDLLCPWLDTLFETMEPNPQSQSAAIAMALRLFDVGCTPSSSVSNELESLLSSDIYEVAGIAVEAFEALAGESNPRGDSALGSLVEHGLASRLPRIRARVARHLAESASRGIVMPIAFSTKLVDLLSGLESGERRWVLRAAFLWAMDHEKGAEIDFGYGPLAGTTSPEEKVLSGILLERRCPSTRDLGAALDSFRDTFLRPESSSPEIVLDVVVGLAGECPELTAPVNTFLKEELGRASSPSRHLLIAAYAKLALLHLEAAESTYQIARETLVGSEDYDLKTQIVRRVLTPAVRRYPSLKTMVRQDFEKLMLERPFQFQITGTGQPTLQLSLWELWLELGREEALENGPGLAWILIRSPRPFASAATLELLAVVAMSEPDSIPALRRELERLGTGLNPSVRETAGKAKQAVSALELCSAAPNASEDRLECLESLCWFSLPRFSELRSVCSRLSVEAVTGLNVEEIDLSTESTLVLEFRDDEYSE